jgi:hypothetical protein
VASGNNTVQIIINVTGNAQDTITGIGQAATRQTGSIIELSQKIRDIGLAFQFVSQAYGSLRGSMAEAVSLYRDQSVAVTRLQQVMSNMMGARAEEVQGILAVAEAQQKLGVIGADVQLAGAQEMATYLSKADSLRKVIPVMNDMMAQQYGLNATAQDAVNIGTMLGKVLQGQTGALSRYGYYFDGAQEKILKFGTEEERVAVLSRIVGETVGGVNQALAQTPEGRMKQSADAMDDLKARAGSLLLGIQAALSPAVSRIAEIIDSILGKFEQYRERITAIAGVIADYLVTGLNALWTVVRALGEGIAWFVRGFNEGHPVFVGAAVALGGIAVALVAYQTVMVAVTAATRIWAAVQAVLNALMTANPVGLIIAGIVALVAAIVFLVMKIKGWGTLWEATVSFITSITKGFVESVKLSFNAVVNGIMIAIDRIREGWYRFKEAVGLGDSGENRSMIARIAADVEERKKALADGARKVVEYGAAVAKSWEKVNLGWDSSVTVRGTVDRLKAQLGISDHTMQVNNDLSTTLSQSSEHISTGGKSVKNFNITINDGLIKQVDNHFAGTNETPQSADDFMWRLSQALQMVLNDVNYAAE